MDIYAIFMGAAFAGMAAFFGLLIVLFRAWAKTKERPQRSDQALSSVAIPRESVSVPAHRERELSELLAAVSTLTRELEETANAAFRRFEQKERRLTQLIAEAETAASRLESRAAPAPVSASGGSPVRQYAVVEDLVPQQKVVPVAPPSAEPRVSTQGKYAKAAELMALGRSASDVSRELSLHVGELELINNLRKIGM
jgi:hypothetical protein